VVDIIFPCVGYDENTGEQIEGQVMNPSGKQQRFVGKESADSVKGIKVLKSFRADVREYKPGIYKR